MSERLKTNLAVFLAFSVIFLSVYNNVTDIFAKESKPPKKTVIIDAGHGGFDSGAVANDGTYEKDINLQISKKLKSLLSDLGYDTIVTRETDDALKNGGESSVADKQGDLKCRLNIMQENPDSIFISIHQNKFEQESVWGLQVFYSNFENSNLLAKNIQDRWNESAGKEKPRCEKNDTRGVFILRNAVVPSIIIECGFLSNNDELRRLKSEEYQNELCSIIADGIDKYFEEKEEVKNGEN